MNSEQALQPNTFNEFKLLSLNEARKQLGIRIGNLKKLIRDKKLISKDIGNKTYVPVQSIRSYVNNFDEELTKPSQIKLMKERINK